MTRSAGTARNTDDGQEEGSDAGQAAILGREPDWHALPVATPEAIRRLLRRSLQNDVKLRLRDIADARLELQDPPWTDLGAHAASPTCAVIIRVDPRRLRRLLVVRSELIP